MKSGPRKVIDLGLQRIANVLKALGNPQNQTPVIHVAGTNGKGSVSAFLHSILKESGIKTGLFTSPHLIHVTESIKVGDQFITCQQLSTLKEEVLQASTRVDQCGQQQLTNFELLTAVAFLHFERTSCQVAVIEVGLGGTLDATNVVQSPLMSVITHIGLDHTAFLGTTLEQICEQKCGIIKRGCPVVVSEYIVGSQPEENQRILQVVQQKAAKESASELIVCQSASWIPPSKQDGTGNESISEPLSIVVDFRAPQKQAAYKKAVFSIPLAGDCQLVNCAIVWEVVRYLQSKQAMNPAFAALTQESILRGFSATKWPGRLQWIDPQFLCRYMEADLTECNSVPLPLRASAAPLLLLDGAHNTSAAKQLRRYVDTLSWSTSLNRTPAMRRVIWIAGMCSGKDAAGFFATVLKPDDVVYAVPFGTPKDMEWIQCMDPESLCLLLNPKLASHQAMPSLDSALQKAYLKALDDAKNHIQSFICITGSFYLVADFMRLFYQKTAIRLESM